MMLTIPEAARELRSSRSHLYRILAGRFPTLPPLPTIRLGRRILIRKDALLEWLACWTHGSPASLCQRCFLPVH